MKNPVQLVDLSDPSQNSLLSDFKWAPESGDALVIEYSFMAASSEFLIDDVSGYSEDDPLYDFPFRAGYGGLDEEKRSLTRAVFEDIEQIVDIQFVEVADSPESDIRIGVTDLDSDGAAGLAFGPASEFLPFEVDLSELHSPSALSGDIWLDDNLHELEFRETLIHEIGHALGLSHPFEDGFFVLKAESPELDGELDYNRFTIMSYNFTPASVDEDDVIFYSVASTFMPLDIDALVHLYGAASVDAKDDLYLVSHFQGDDNSAVVADYADLNLHEYFNSYLSIVDGGGYNVLYLAVEEDLTLDLAAGAWSNTAGGLLTEKLGDDNLYLSPETVISEWVTAGGDDLVYDGPGDHFVQLGDGNDQFYFDSGVDNVQGGSGQDTVYMEGDYRHFRFVELTSERLRVRQIVGDDELELGSIESLQIGDRTFSTDTMRSDIMELNRDYLVLSIGPHYLSAITRDEGENITSPEAQLYRFYYGSLGRAPDQDGYDWWLQNIENDTFDFSEVAARFVDSPEFVELGDANSNGTVTDLEFILHMYENVFGRARDQEGFGWWLTQLTQGVHDQGSAFASMVQSDEFVLLTAGTVSEFLFA